MNSPENALLARVERNAEVLIGFGEVTLISGKVFYALRERLRDAEIPFRWEMSYHRERGVSYRIILA